MFANPQLKEKQRRSIRASQMTLDYFCWLTMNIRADWGDITSADRAENNFSLREAPKTTKPSQRKPKSRRNDLRMKPFSDFQIKNHIHVMLRQADLDVLPDKYFMNEWLRQRADETRVQAVYENVKAELDPNSRETIQKRTADGGWENEITSFHLDKVFQRCHARIRVPTPTKPKAFGSGIGELENWMLSIVQKLN